MYCRVCDHAITVPDGPVIPDDVDLSEEETDETEAEDVNETESPLPMITSLVGAVVGLVLMGFYVTFTVNFASDVFSGGGGVTAVANGRADGVPSQLAANRATGTTPVGAPRVDGTSPAAPPGNPFIDEPPPVGPNDDPPDDRPSRRFGVIQRLEFSPVGGLVATSSSDGSVSIWDRDGNLKQEFRAHRLPVRHLRFTPEGSRVVSVAPDSRVGIFEVRPKFVGRLVPFPNTTSAPFAISPSGRLAAISDNRGGVHFVDTVDGRIVSNIPVGIETPFDFVGEKDFLVVGRNSAWKFLNTSGEVRSSGVLAGKKVLATGAASRRGLLAMSNSGEQIELFHAFAGRRWNDIPVEFPPAIMRFSPDGAYLAYVDRLRNLVAYDVTVDPARKIHQAEGVHIGVGFSEESELLYAKVDDKEPGRPVTTSVTLPAPRGPAVEYTPPPTLPAGVDNPTPSPMPIELKTDPEQPIVITSFEPPAAAPGTLLVIRGKGFAETQAVVFGSYLTYSSPEMAVRNFRVISDEELRVLVPEIVSKQKDGTILEIYTPEGVGVTWPVGSHVLGSGKRAPPNHPFAYVPSGVSVDERPAARNVFMETGSSVTGLYSTRAYVRGGAVVGADGKDNGIVASKQSTVRVSFEPETSLNVSDVYPSFVPRILNQR